MLAVMYLILTLGMQLIVTLHTLSDCTKYAEESSWSSYVCLDLDRVHSAVVLTCWGPQIVLLESGSNYRSLTFAGREGGRLACILWGRWQLSHSALSGCCSCSLCCHHFGHSRRQLQDCVGLAQAFPQVQDLRTGT